MFPLVGALNYVFDDPARAMTSVRKAGRRKADKGEGNHTCRWQVGRYARRERGGDESQI